MILKRVFCAALAAAAIMAFAGCGKTESSSSKAESSQTETQAQTAAKSTADEASATGQTAAEKHIPGKLYALNQKEGESPAITALKLVGNRVGSEVGVNGWEASADMIRCVFEQNEWIELYPQTEQTGSLAAYLVPHTDDTASYVDSFTAALSDDVPRTELIKPEEENGAWGSFYAHPEVYAPGYYDVVITSDLKPVAMVMVKIYAEGSLSDKDDAALEQLISSEVSSFEQQLSSEVSTLEQQLSSENSTLEQQ